jgi:hypothetical protein
VDMNARRIARSFVTGLPPEYNRCRGGGQQALASSPPDQLD